MGIKAVAVYRDGSKAQQVLATKPKKEDYKVEIVPGSVPANSGPHPDPSSPADEVEIMSAETWRAGGNAPYRERLPRTRKSITHKFSIDGHEGYVTAGMHEDGRLGEIFVSGLGKEGSTLTGVIGAWSIAISMGLQYGVPLEDFVRKYAHMRFDPEGLTENPDIRKASSICDYIMRWLASQFLSVDLCEELGVMTPEVKKRKTSLLDDLPLTSAEEVQASEERGERWVDFGLPVSHVDLGPACSQCGSIMQRTGTCYACPECGNTTGC
jgi:ribonucleoside-diphosphate reductase alpha chain